ncbi:MAG: hypothetical protein OEV42_17785, partial [Deltaproteobacteria bacterium]|nr:hypothetical protein [Deltaproteobacteria bacterium]
MKKNRIYLMIVLFILSVSYPLLSTGKTIDPPHDGAVCKACHSGNNWDALYDRAPRCLNCHSSGGVAGKTPFAANDASGLFNFTTSGEGALEQHSHAWGVPL